MASSVVLFSRPVLIEVLGWGGCGLAQDNPDQLSAEKADEKNSDR
jgi:hypothetical protein